MPLNRVRSLAAALALSVSLSALPAGPAPIAPTIAPWGFDLAGEDPSVSPGANFYDFANGKYVKSLVIPPDRTRYGSFDMLAMRSEQRVHDLIADVARDSSAIGDEAKVGAFYRAFMDDDRVEALGARPIEPELAKVRAASDRSAIARLMGESQTSFASSFVDLGITSDFKDPDHYAVYIGQGGLGLPDRDYYLDANFAAQKAKYQAYVAQMLSLVKWPDAEAQAKAIVDLETQIATVSWPLAERLSLIHI